MRFNEHKAAAQLEHDIGADCAAGRQRVRRAAQNGKPPLQVFDQKTLDQLFDGHTDELNDAIATATRVRAERHDREQRAQQNAELRTETNRVLSEWAKAEEAERRGKAEAEAKRRLGWDRADAA